jgi:hypothetical protein
VIENLLLKITVVKSDRKWGRQNSGASKHVCVEKVKSKLTTSKFYRYKKARKTELKLFTKKN